ncbi:hypothetical protein [Mycolicibacterium thermoresistibile]
MTGPLRRLKPRHPLDVLSAVWSTAAATPVNWLVQGRRLTVRIDGTDVGLTITEFDSRLDVLRLSVGQLSEVHLAARDIQWADNRIDRVTAVLHNVRIQPSTRPELVAAPVHLTADIPAGVVPGWFASVAPRVSGDVGHDGIARIWLTRRPGWGQLLVDARLDDPTPHTPTPADPAPGHPSLWLYPRAVVWRRRRIRLPARLPGYRLRLPDLPHGLRLTGLGFAPGQICLSGELTEWRIPVAALPSI